MHVFSLKVLLHTAALARVRRMVAEKKKRKDLEVDQSVKDKWNKGGKHRDMMAELLKKVNFDKDWNHVEGLQQSQ